MPVTILNSDGSEETEVQAPEFPGLYALSVLYETARDCQRCDLSKTRKKVVFGLGNSEFPDIAFVGGAPRGEDDESGYPFTGESSVVLHKAIVAMGYKVEDVYRCHAVACHPPYNRTPHKEEVTACLPVWQSQLIAVQPKVIVCLGGVAGNAVLSKQEDLIRLCGKWHTWRLNIPVRVTFAPGFVKDDATKSALWDELKAVLQKLAELRNT